MHKNAQNCRENQSTQLVNVNFPVTVESESESGFTSVFKDQTERFKCCSKALWGFNRSVIVLCMFDILRGGVVPRAFENLGFSLRSPAKGETCQGGYRTEARARDKRAVEHC